MIKITYFQLIFLRPYWSMLYFQIHGIRKKPSLPLRFNLLLSLFRYYSSLPYYVPLCFTARLSPLFPSVNFFLPLPHILIIHPPLLLLFFLLPFILFFFIFLILHIPRLSIFSFLLFFLLPFQCPDSQIMCSKSVSIM